MGEFNLLDEGWISVVTDYKGTTKPVGMKEFFENAHEYIPHKTTKLSRHR